MNKELIDVNFDIAFVVIAKKRNFFRAVSKFSRVKTKWKELVIDTR